MAKAMANGSTIIGENQRNGESGQRKAGQRISVAA